MVAIKVNRESTQEIVVASFKNAWADYWSPLIRVFRRVRRSRQALRQAWSTSASRIRRIEWIQDAQLQETISLRQYASESESKLLRAVCDLDSSHRDQMQRLHAELEKITRIQVAPVSLDTNALRLATRLADLQASINDPWTRTLAESVIRQASRTLEGLSTPVAIYRGEVELYRALTECVDGLNRHDTLFAACAEKSWEEDSLKMYFQANVRAVGRGVQITRIFQETDDRRAVEAAKIQAKQGIYVRVLRRRHLQQLTADQRLPPEIGIAIINGETTIVHRGLGPAAYACRFDCPELAAALRSQFDLMERLAEPYESGVVSGYAALRRFPLT
jgi:hypothetical protein